MAKHDKSNDNAKADVNEADINEAKAAIVDKLSEADEISTELEMSNELAEAFKNKLIINAMLDWKFSDDVRYSEKRKTTADKSDVQRTNMVEMYFDGVSLRNSIVWTFSNRWIAEQTNLRTLGDAYLVKHYNLVFKLIDSGKRSVFVDTSPEAVADKLIADGMDENEFIAKLLKAAATKRALIKQQTADEAELMDGVTIPNE